MAGGATLDADTPDQGVKIARRNTVDLATARTNLRVVERALELRALDAVTPEVRDAVAGYNRDDCRSALHLRAWLEQLRATVEDGGTPLPRPEPGDGAPRPAVDERGRRVRALMEALTAGVPGDRAERTEEQQARWLLAHLLEWHRREDKAPWWEFFRLIELSDEELFEERSALAQLQFVAKVGGTDRNPIHRYAFPVQETSIRDDDELEAPGAVKIGKVENINLQERRIDIKKRAAAADIHPSAVFSHTLIGGTEMAEALFRIARWVSAHSIDGAGLYRAARDLLLRRP